MSVYILPSLKLTRLLLRKGDLHEARLAAEDARLDALILDDRTQWLDGTRLVFQCCQELDELNAAEPAMTEVLQFLKTEPSIELQAQAHTILSSWYLAQGNPEEFQKFMSLALDQSTTIKDIDTLARALSIYSLSLAMKPETEALALPQLDKIDVLMAERDNPETRLSAKLLRGFIYTQKKQTEAALELLWQSYEEAKLHGFHLLISSILAQIARVYRDQKQDEQYRTYADLAIRGLDKNKTPRLHKLVFQVCPPETLARRSAFDFKINERTRAVHEKTKGVVDFKNQHILFEMALLFIKNPGKRFLKEDLARNIWNQSYEPDLHDNLIYVSIKRLRTLLEPDLESPRYILRDRKGYYFNSQAVVQFRHSEEASL